jgi:hypothetical protein
LTVRHELAKIGDSTWGSLASGRSAGNASGGPKGSPDFFASTSIRLDIIPPSSLPQHQDFPDFQPFTEQIDN